VRYFKMFEKIEDDDEKRINIKEHSLTVNKVNSENERIVTGLDWEYIRSEVM